MKVEVRFTVEKDSLIYKFDIPTYEMADKLFNEINSVLVAYNKYKAKPAKSEDERQLSLPLQDVPGYEFEGSECECTRSGIESEPAWNKTEKRFQCQACGGYFEETCSS